MVDLSGETSQHRPRRPRTRLRRRRDGEVCRERGAPEPSSLRRTAQQIRSGVRLRSEGSPPHPLPRHRVRARGGNAPVRIQRIRRGAGARGVVALRR